jgi:2-polyprenyl-3-methyl-5-hydroxy-6-metoxy-1,4-benzoquinol methylase
MAYYTNVNIDLLASIPITAHRILEIGCGDGSFGLAVKARNPRVEYFGVEVFEAVATIANQRLDRVIHGDIETEEVFQSVLDVYDKKPFDVIIFGDVLEHLIDPWKLLEKLRALMAVNGACVACIPNIGHWSIHKQLLSGRWDYADAGLLDRTHLRFFTQATMHEMFTGAGFSVVKCQPRIIQQSKTTEAIELLQPLLESYGLNTEKAKLDLSAFQWIIVGVNGDPSPPLCLAALSIRKFAGVNEARIDMPLNALKSLPEVHAVWGENSLSIPRDFQPGVLILHRQFLANKVIAQHVERYIAKGWVVVSDIDDDPSHWPGYVDSDFIAFRGVHGVSVSTERLRSRVLEYNKNIALFPNAVFELPRFASKPSAKGEQLRVFFGALNRQEDWNEIKAELLPALEQLRDQIEFVVVHDASIYDSLPLSLKKEFHPTLGVGEYMKVLSTCDIALLPLRDTKFNNLKSDIKLIECCACGVVPIMAQVVYSDTKEAGEIGVLMKPGESWGQALLALVNEPERLIALRKAGLSYVTTQRMHSHTINDRLDWYHGLIANKAQLEVERQERLRAIGLSGFLVD